MTDHKSSVQQRVLPKTLSLRDCDIATELLYNIPGAGSAPSTFQTFGRSNRASGPEGTAARQSHCH